MMLQNHIVVTQRGNPIKERNSAALIGSTALQHAFGYWIALNTQNHSCVISVIIITKAFIGMTTSLASLQTHRVNNAIL